MGETMNKKIAELLVDYLEAHPNMISVDKDYFVDILMQTKIPQKSDEFYHKIPPNHQSIDSDSRIYSFSLRRILRNRNAKKYRIGLIRSALGAIGESLRIYDSSLLARKIRKSRKLVEMMDQVGIPYSLLGKFEIIDYESSVKCETKPILIIPGVEDLDAILAWENKKKRVYEEIRIDKALSHPKMT
ncbi:hypothetical protein GOV06_00805 [Candidatus Woesearchaeota archaeon]|nr:hypothetical protein [Candidatus Woesearchaeota archaeon]